MSKRRPNGDGMVRKRPDGRWEARIIVGHKEDGKPIYKSVFGKTQSEAMTKFYKLLETYRGVELNEDCLVNLNEWLDRWLCYQKDVVRPQTLNKYIFYADAYVSPLRISCIDVATVAETDDQTEGVGVTATAGTLGLTVCDLLKDFLEKVISCFRGSHRIVGAQCLQYGLRKAGLAFPAGIHRLQLRVCCGKILLQLPCLDCQGAASFQENIHRVDALLQ